MMDCPSMSEWIEYLAGVSGEARLAEHLESCLACRGRMETLRRLREEAGGQLASIAPERLPQCPPWEDLAAWIEAGSAGAGLPGHVAGCESCLLQVTAYRAGIGLGTLKAPAPPLVRLRLPSLARRRGEPVSRKWFALSAGAAALAGLLVLLSVRDAMRPGLPLYSTRPSSSTGELAPAKKPSVTPLPGRSTEPASAPPVASTPARESARFRSMPQPQGSLSVTLRYDTPAGVASLPLPSSQQPVLFSNGKYALQLRYSSPVWLYVFQKDARGRVSVLFPNPDYNTGANPLPPVDAYTLPAAGRWYQLDEAVGLETLYVVCAARRLEICERLQRLAQAEAVKSEVGEMLRDLQRTSVAPGPESKGHTVFVQQFDHRGRVNE